MSGKIVIYGDKDSGNCLKVKYISDYLGIRYQWRHVDLHGETRTPTYLGCNPMGQIPLLELPDGRSSPNPMLFCAIWPETLHLAAKMDAWLFWEQ